MKKEMTHIIKIGYQGAIGSNSEEAARHFAKKLYLHNAMLIPFVKSSNVVAALLESCIDYGVMATENSIAGEVHETKIALDSRIELCSRISLPIHHCIFIKNPNVKIKFISSHVQALKQTENTYRQILPNVIAVECADTAVAAEMLYKGLYPDNYAIICRKNTGLLYGLHLLAENVEDNKSNITVFGLFKLN